MSLRTGIAGRPNAGKSTLFNALTLAGRSSLPTLSPPSIPTLVSLAAGSAAAARSASKIRLEGRDYLVQDGDVIHSRFNV